jgi:hypothetical protein
MRADELIWGCAYCNHEAAGADWVEDKCPMCRRPYDEDLHDALLRESLIAARNSRRERRSQ